MYSHAVDRDAVGLEQPRRGAASVYPHVRSRTQRLGDGLGCCVGNIADGGIAGEVSNNGPALVRRCLDLFPNSRYVIIGFGTNDLASPQPVEELSQRIISNMDSMVKAVCEHGKQPILFNAPYVRESSFPSEDAVTTHQMRDYHNVKLQEYCDREGVPLVDICWHLRDEHFGDEVHPNALGARIIAERVFDALSRIHQSSDGKLVE